MGELQKRKEKKYEINTYKNATSGVKFAYFFITTLPCVE